MDLHVKYLFTSSLSLIFIFNKTGRERKLERKKIYIPKNCMWLTSKQFNWTSRYKNPDGPCAVQASGDRNVLPCVRHFFPSPFPGEQRTFNQDIRGLQNLYFNIFGGFKEILGDTWGIWDYHTSILVKWIKNIPILVKWIKTFLFFTFWDDERQLVLSGCRTDLSDLHLEWTTSINMPHLDLAPDLQLRI